MNPQQSPRFAIDSPVAVVNFVVPQPPPPLNQAITAMDAFERQFFPIGSAVNDQYQIILAPWRDLTLAITVFPGGQLAALSGALQAHGLTVQRGVPYGSRVGVGEPFDVEGHVQRVLGLAIEGRAYLVVALPGPASASA
jgi:hypothetical protein